MARAKPESGPARTWQYRDPDTSTGHLPSADRALVRDDAIDSLVVDLGAALPPAPPNRPAERIQGRLDQVVQVPRVVRTYSERQPELDLNLETQAVRNFADADRITDGSPPSALAGSRERRWPTVDVDDQLT
jgi:hypothetical protein